MTRYLYQFIGRNPDQVVIALRRDGFVAYAERELDTQGLIITESIMTNASLGSVLSIAGHGQAFTKDVFFPAK